MKRCPQCNRVETDEALKFCRVDGATLINDSSSVGEAGTARLGSQSDASEVHTSILPSNTQANVIRATGPTTALPSEVSDTTSELSKPRRLKVAIVIAVVLVTALVAVTAAVIVNSYRSKTGTAAIASIAVLPFVNESGSADVEYLSDGMTETLIRSLSRLPNLSVKARSSVFRYKGKATDVKTIGKDLNVQAVLNGRVMQRGDQLTLRLELVNAETENVIWSEEYNRRQSDLVNLQSEIARDVSNKLKSKLSGADEAKVTKSATTSPEAYQSYLKGRYFWNRRTGANLKKAIEQFKIATDQDPNYALAYAGLADCYALLPEYGGVPASEVFPQAKTYAERAIAIDSQLAEPHATLGLLNHKTWQWAEAEREQKRAIELNPNYATAYQWYSVCLRDLGRLDESALMITRAHELDPLSSIIGTNVSEIYQLQNNYNDAIANSLKIIELDPTFWVAYTDLGYSYLKQGRSAEAIITLEKAVELSNRDASSLGDLGYGYGVIGKRAEATAIVKELEAKYARKESNGANLAAVYAGLGNKDKAFEWLEKDFQNKGELDYLSWALRFEPLHDDPRFKDLLRRMGLP